MSRGDLVVGNVRALPERERELLLSYEIDSILVVPIFAGQHWWGFVGFDQCGSMRAIRPGLPAVIMSGYDEHELTSCFVGLEPISFLQKPFAAQALYHCIEQALSGALPDA